MDKRSFIKNLAFGTVGLSMGKPKFQEMMIHSSGQSTWEATSDEAFWKEVRKGYRLKEDYINLENGYYNFIPQETLEKYIAHIREINFQGQHYMRTVQWDNKQKVAARLAGMLDCGTDELIITRNTTESLDTVIAGYPWKAGDEAVMAEQDYGAMLDMFKQVAERHGIVNRLVSVPNHPSSDEEIVSLYERAITPKTKMLMVCHMINITGQILPVRKICDMAHRKGVQVLVDGAHCVAHIRFSLRELGCDYYGASLHKWLSVPLGAGILYVNRKNAGVIWPMFGDGRPKEDILRLNHTGTHPCATDLAIGDAIDFYNRIGAERKESRLRYLQQYWTSRARKLKGVVLNTPEDPARACGIANVGIQGMSPETMAKTLLSKYGIFTVAIDYANVHGCRITPNLYTTTEELDAFVKALGEMGAGAV